MNINVQPLVESNNTFALDLYAKLSAGEDNLCFSPYSISVALAMTLAGARGITEKQMKDVLHTTLTQYEYHAGFAQLQKQIRTVGKDKNVELLLANSIYPHNKYVFLESFVICLRENYGTIITPLDYNEPESARKFVNQWVQEETQEHISELIPAGVLDSLTRLILVNAIYFKGLWEKQFDKQKTIISPFWVTSDKSVEVPTMRQKAAFKYTEDDLVQILDLPYQGNGLSLIIILPKEHNTPANEGSGFVKIKKLKPRRQIETPTKESDNLAKVERFLSLKKLSLWSKNMSEQTVEVHLPLFKIKSNLNLNKLLISMGMSDAFGERADFSGMDRTKELSIKHVFHQATVDVNEEGATATAATAVVMAIRGLPQEYQFHASHPFIFLLRENTTGSILFIGRVLNPVV